MEQLKHLLFSRQNAACKTINPSHDRNETWYYCVGSIAVANLERKTLDAGKTPLLSIRTTQPMRDNLINKHERKGIVPYLATNEKADVGPSLDHFLLVGGRVAPHFAQNAKADILV
jgi:hypothetical protein